MEALRHEAPLGFGVGRRLLVFLRLGELFLGAQILEDISVLVHDDVVLVTFAVGRCCGLRVGCGRSTAIFGRDFDGVEELGRCGELLLSIFELVAVRIQQATGRLETSDFLVREAFQLLLDLGNFGGFLRGFFAAGAVFRLVEIL